MNRLLKSRYLLQLIAILSLINGGSISSYETSLKVQKQNLSNKFSDSDYCSPDKPITKLNLINIFCHKLVDCYISGNEHNQTATCESDEPLQINQIEKLVTIETKGQWIQTSVVLKLTLDGDQSVLPGPPILFYYVQVNKKLDSNQFSEPMSNMVNCPENNQIFGNDHTTRHEETHYNSYSVVYCAKAESNSTSETSVDYELTIEAKK